MLQTERLKILTAEEEEKRSVLSLTAWAEAG
jgi:hypothetical protein